jgi:hypothetical protein
MKSKRQTAIYLLVLILIVAVVAIVGARRAYAVQPNESPQTVGLIPKSYGSLKGAGLGVLIFEDKDGTIRVVSVDTHQYPEGHLIQVWQRN